MPGLLSATSALPQKRRCHGAEKALALLTQPLSKDLPERHIASLKHLCAELEHGCTSDNLPIVSKVLGIVIGNVKAEPDGSFEEVACELLRVLSRPYVRLHASDDLALGEKISELFEVVQQCLDSGMPAVLSRSAAALFEDFVDNFQTNAGCATSNLDSAPSCLNQQAHIRLLAENHICFAVVQALKHAVESPGETLPSSLPHDFSIAAVQPRTSSMTTSNRHDVSRLDSGLSSALLRAAVAFSASQQLSEQLLSSGVMSPIALLLNQGGVHNHHTSLVIELLWNLLEACPVSDADTDNQFAVSKSDLAARHSQILKPRQKTFEETSNSGAWQDADYKYDAEQLSGVSPDDIAQIHEDVQQQDDAEANMEYGDGIEEDSTQEPQQASIEGSAEYSSSVVGSAADTEDAVEPSAATGDIATEGDAAATADEGVSTGAFDSGRASAEPCLSADSNIQAGADHDDSASSPVEDDNSAEADMSAVPDAEDADTAATTDAVGVEEDIAAGIIRVLTDCMEHGYSTADKELRNTVLVVAGMLAESRRYRSALCCQEMLQQLVIASTEPELGDCSTDCFKASRQSIDGEDFELRQLAWTSLARLLQHDPAAVDSQAYSFMRVLLQYIQLDDGYENWPLHWTLPQLSTLRQVALHMLHSMAPTFPQVYQQCGGPASVLHFLAGCSDSKLLETGLHHMHQACTASALLCTTWAGQGSMELALAVAVDSSWPVHVRRTALLLVSVLCRGSAEAVQHFRQLEGVGSLCLELEKLKVVGKEPATLYDFAVLDALWSGIVQSAAAMKRFLLADGLGSLLDLLDQGAAALQPLLLTIIAGIQATRTQSSADTVVKAVQDVLGSDSGKHIQATDLLYEWVSSKWQSACHMILQLWRQEEEGRGVSSPYCIAPQHHSACLSPRLTAAAVGTANDSTSGGAVQMKIHAIFSQLGFEEAAAHMDLPDQATLCAVEQYFALQQGIVWQNMADTFAAEGLDPTEEDQLRIKDGVKQAADIRQSVQEKQQALMQAHADQLLQADLEFIRAKRAQDKRDAEARRYHKDMSTLTVKERTAAKVKREQMLLESFIKQEESPMFEDDLAIEAFYRRPSHAAQHEIVKRLSVSQSQTARAAAELLVKQIPEQKRESKVEQKTEQKTETKTYSPRNSIRRGLSIPFLGELLEPGLSGNLEVEVDMMLYENMERDSASEHTDSDDEPYDSD